MWPFLPSFVQRQHDKSQWKYDGEQALSHEFLTGEVGGRCDSLRLVRITSPERPVVKPKEKAEERCGGSGTPSVPSGPSACTAVV